MSTNQDELEPEIVEERIDGSLALSVVTRAEIDMQVTTAKAYPRSVTNFKKQAKELACLNPETAETMFYAMKRGGKLIEGPSVRLAEVVQVCWGNFRAESNVVSIDDRYVTAMGSALDLEKNVATRIHVKRRITDRNGRRFNDDMIGVTSNAACAIAFREAVFKVVPRALFQDIYEQARRTAVGDAKSITQTRLEEIQRWGLVGITSDQLLKKLGRTGVDEITIDDLLILKGLRSAIRDGELTLDAAFAEETNSHNPPPSESAADLTAALTESPAFDQGQTLDAVPEPTEAQWEEIRKETLRRQAEALKGEPEQATLLK